MRSLTEIIKGFLRRPQKYLAVPSASLEKPSRTSDEDTLDGQEDEQALMGDKARYRIRHQRHRIGVLAVISAICAFVLSTIGAFLVGRSWQPHIDKQSTVMEEVDNGLRDVRFNGTLGKNSEFTGHWGDPDETMDRNWNKWGFVKYASFSREEFEAMGMDLEGSAKFTEEYGGGYIGFLEISHQMHCLNVIRQAYHWEYYEQPEHRHWASWIDDYPITIKVHINHCFEMLRQLIMCNADLGVIPHHWVKDIQDPYANFNTVHKCRDLDSVAKWIERHEVPPPPETGYPMPAGSKVWPRPP